MAKKKTVKDVESVAKTKAKKAKQEELEVETEEIVELEVEDASLKESKKKTEKSSKKKDTPKEKKEGYIKSVRKELKKVVWPKGGEILKYTLAVIFLCLVLGLFFAGVELLAAFIKGLFV